jgi:hypothetical protein
MRSAAVLKTVFESGIEMVEVCVEGATGVRS